MTVENLKDFDRTLFGTKVLNLETKKLGIVLYTWTNVYADGNIPFATCVDENGKRYNVSMDNIQVVEDLNWSYNQKAGRKFSSGFYFYEFNYN